MRIAILLTGLLALSGCQVATIIPEGSPLSVSYKCENAPALSVIFYEAGGTATVGQLGLNQHVLYIQPAGSGYHYAADGYELRGQGGQAMWTANGKTVNCTAVGDRI